MSEQYRVRTKYTRCRWKQCKSCTKEETKYLNEIIVQLHSSEFLSSTACQISYLGYFFRPFSYFRRWKYPTYPKVRMNYRFFLYGIWRRGKG